MATNGPAWPLLMTHTSGREHIVEIYPNNRVVLNWKGRVKRGSAFLLVTDAQRTLLEARSKSICHDHSSNSETRKILPARSHYVFEI